MEHIVRSLYTSELSEHVDERFEDGEDHRSSQRLSSTKSAANLRRISRRSERPHSPVSGDGTKVTPEMESRLFRSPSGAKNKRLSGSSLVDVADRHLRDKTESIANIIRNISDQCAAAVEGLQLAHNAEHDVEVEHTDVEDGNDGSDAGEATSEAGFDDARSSITAASKRSSMPPTPDLYRSSTAMSMNSISTAADRNSQQFSTPGLAPKIAEGDVESEQGSVVGTSDSPAVSKPHDQDAVRPVTTHLAS